MDVIKQITHGGAALLAKVLLGKDIKNEIEVFVETISPSEMHIIINALTSEGKLNEAEDLLFELMKSNPSRSLYNTGLYFYERLSEMKDEYLDSCSFAREEIAKGLADFEELKKSSLIID